MYYIHRNNNSNSSSSKNLVFQKKDKTLSTESNNNSIIHGSVTDIDGNIYKTVTIGKQEWMAENLNVEHYRNGDPVQQVKIYNDWKKLTTGACCYYENDSKYGKTYGKLYNWYAVNDPRGLAPEGWHIPSDAEWKQLEEVFGCFVGKLKATTLWKSPNRGATNKSGFTALPGGFRVAFGVFLAIGLKCCFWSSSKVSNSIVLNTLMSEYEMTFFDGGVDGDHRLSFFMNYDCLVSLWSSNLMTYGFSIRCVKD